MDPKIIELLSRGDIESSEWIVAMSRALHVIDPEEYRSYTLEDINTLGDGVKRSIAHDVSAFIVNNPEYTTSLGNYLKCQLYWQGAIKDIGQAISENEDILEQIQGEMDNMFARYQSLDDFSDYEVLLMEANRVLLGEPHGLETGDPNIGLIVSFEEYWKDRGHVESVVSGVGPHMSSCPEEPNNVIMLITDEREAEINPKFISASIRSAVQEATSAPSIYKSTSCGEGQAIDECTLGTIRNHVTQEGVIDELTIVAHGRIQNVGSLGPSYNMSVGNFLRELADLNRSMGGVTCKRIVFDSCSAFHTLSNEEIKWLRDYADMHNVEIVGTITNRNTIWSLDSKDVDRKARFVQFTPDGEVIFDRYDDKDYADSDDVELYGQEYISSHPEEFESMPANSWANYHIGRSHEEAVQLMESGRQGVEPLEDINAGNQSRQRSILDLGI